MSIARMLVALIVWACISGLSIAESETASSSVSKTTPRGSGADCSAIEATRLAKEAKRVLDDNWTGQSTKPSPSLYPHQWSWDSAFIAMSYAHFNQQRAMTELRSLFAGQWSSGLLPHIVFNPQYLTNYFPGPSTWKTNTSPDAPKPPARQTSGIVQPPVHATAVHTIFRHATNITQAEDFLREMVPKLVKWHDYLAEERDIDSDGLVYIRHPWESGMDNSAAWDGPLQRIHLTPDMVPPYQRVDNKQVDPDQRPTKFDYDRYIYLVSLFYKAQYNETEIRDTCPFLVQDVSFNSIWARANFDLARLVNAFSSLPNSEEIARTAMARANKTVMAIKTKLWKNGFFYSYDLVNKTLLERKTSASFLPLWATTEPGLATETVTEQQALTLVAQLYSDNFMLPEASVSTVRDSLTGWKGYSIPSLSRTDANFSLVNYWRGPVWINVNFMVYHGFEHLALNTAFSKPVRDLMESTEKAIVRHTYKLVQESGYHEYFNVDTGDGLGTGNFSWSAALVLLQLDIDCKSQVHNALFPPAIEKMPPADVVPLIVMLVVFAALLSSSFLLWHVQEKKERSRGGAQSVQVIQFSKLSEDAD